MESRSAGRRRVLGVALVRLVVLISITAPVAACSNSPGGRTPSVSSGDMARVVRERLPAGRVSHLVSKGLHTGENGLTSPSGLPSADLVFGQGRGKARVTVSLGRLPSGVDASHFINCPDTALHPYSLCRSTRLADGALRVVDRSPVDERRPSAGRRWNVQWVGPGNHQVSVTEEDTAPEAEPRSGTSFPLDLTELESIASAPEWVRLADRIPVSHHAFDGSGTSSLRPEQVAHTLSGLAPHATKVADQGGSAGFYHVTVDDGHGKSLITVNVQKWNPATSPLEKAFAKIPASPDGTRIRTDTAHPAVGGKGTVERTADVYRPDGYRIVVTSLNAPTYVVPATRADPALGIAQLKAIALNHTWDVFESVAQHME